MAERLTTKQAAEILGVHPVTMRKWRENSILLEHDIFEDTRGLHWWFWHARQVMYDGSTVRRLKELLDRRKNK